MKLITHDKTFHYDEVLGTAVLQLIYSDTEVIRTRSKDIIETGDIVYDVGGVYDSARHRYDHHQSTFNDTFSPKYNIKLSSAGLIFKHFHEKLFEIYGFTRKSPIFDFIVEKVYSEFFLPADANDNGYDCIFGTIKARTVADVVRNYNKLSDDSTPEIEMERFMKALNFVSEDLKNYLNYIFTDYVVSYEDMYERVQKCEGDILYVEKSVSSSLIYDIEEDLKKGLKFVIVKTDRDYRIITFPKVRGKFEIKYPLKEEWRGLSGAELDQKSGMEGCVFVHASGFTGGHKTLEGAFEMCRRSLNE